MKKRHPLNILFLKKIISANLLFINTPSNLVTRNYNKACFNQINSLKHLYFLDPVQFIKTIKQFICILKFFKSNELYLTLFFNQSYNKDLFLFMKRKYHFPSSYFNIHSNKTRAQILSLNKISNLKGVINFDSDNYVHTSKFYHQLFLQNIYLVNTIMSRQLFTAFGDYKITADLNNWKTMLFFIILLRKYYLPVEEIKS